MSDTRQPAPDARPVALTIAGSDSGGGAGIQADLKTMEAHGAFATSAITAVTAQNTLGVESSYVLPVAEVRAQLDAVLDDFDVRATKTGMLATAPIVELVAEYAADLDAPLVVDPVMIAASGDRLLDPDAEDAYADLLGRATLVTPNADEAAALTGIEVTDRDTGIAAGRALLDLGADAALVKGGHVHGDRVRDVFVGPDGVETFSHPRIETDATHGSGCTLASAVAARLAHGESLATAVRDAVAFVERAVRYPLAVGRGPGAVHHLVELRERGARQPTAEHVEDVVEAFVDADVSRLVPEVGMNVVGATPYAEATGEVAAVEGRITRTLSGVKPNRGVRFGASSHVARFLLAVREFDPDVRFAVDCRFDAGVEAALDDCGFRTAEFDRAAEPADVKEREGSTMAWGARQVFEGENAGTDARPDAVIDRGEVGKEPILKLVATDPTVLAEKTLALADAAR